MIASGMIDAATVKLPLASLTKDDQDKHCVDEVIGNGHSRHDLLRGARLSSAQGLNRGLIPDSTHGLTRLRQTSTKSHRPPSESLRATPKADPCRSGAIDPLVAKGAHVGALGRPASSAALLCRRCENRGGACRRPDPRRLASARRCRSPWPSSHRAPTAGLLLQGRVAVACAATVGAPFNDGQAQARIRVTTALRLVKTAKTRRLMARAGTGQDRSEPRAPTALAVAGANDEWHRQHLH